MSIVKLTTALILACTLVKTQEQVSDMEAPPVLVDQGLGQNPGMGLRLQEKTIGQMKKAFQRFLPHYIMLSPGLKENEEWDFTTLFGLLKYHFEWSDIHYDEPTLDILDTSIVFQEKMGKHMLKVDFPAIEHWKISAYQKVNTFLLPQDGEVVFEFNDLDFKFNCEFNVSSNGFLHPIVYSTTLKWGKSKFYHTDWYWEFILDTWTRYVLVIIENAIYFLGDYIFTNMLEYPVAALLNYYYLPVYLPPIAPGQDGEGLFNMDFRMTQRPVIEDGFIDLFMVGAFDYSGSEETCESIGFANNNIHFYNNDQVSQLVLTDSAATCAANQLAKSPIGQIQFNSEKWNQFWHVDDFKLDTSSIKKHIKLFEQKIGPDTPLKVDVDFHDVKVYFGQYDTDIAVDYTMCMKFRTDLLGSPELMYDCLEFSTSLDMQIETKNDAEVIRANIIENKLVLNRRGGNRERPKRNSMDMTANEYREFLEDMSFTTTEIKKWLNDVVLRGDNAHMPYRMDEFNTWFKFESQKVHIMIDVEDDAYQLLEEEFDGK